MKRLIFGLVIAALFFQCKEAVEIDPDTLFTLIPNRKTGITFSNDITEDRFHNHIINDMFISGAGVAVGDINNDSLPDLFFTGNQVQDKLYLNLGNLKFKDITEESGIEADENWSTGVTMADINNDGLMDIYICKSVQDNEQLSTNLLYINNGDLTFTERAAEYGLEVLAVETYPKDVVDVSGIMTKFRDLEPDVFVGGGHFNDALLFTRAAKELDFNPKAMVITVGPSNPQFAEEMGADADYIIGPTQWEAVMSYEDEWMGTAAEYGAVYEGMWGETPTYQAAESTAAALTLMVAIEAAGSTDTAAVRDALDLG